ncbi:YppG family protein [Sediminibacillus massiliensis]|uniref:YppG family protein n=1 Tax=Sediminibacillus massiliensis TaxID=1926277 RepID=UPI0015C390D4|nr:YppG family protein [Sediminibacillus massiliensis]
MNHERAPYPFYGQNPQMYDPFYYQGGPVNPGQGFPGGTGTNPYQYFAKPPHPAPWPGFVGSQPGQTGYWQQQSAPGFMNLFQDKNGQMDLDKMLSTVGQMASTVQQVAPIFKGFGSFLQGIK